MKILFFILLILLVLVITTTGCKPPKNCIDRAWDTAELAVSKGHEVRFPYGMLDANPLQKSAGFHIECQVLFGNKWEICHVGGLHDEKLVREGTEMYGFDVERYYTLEEFKHMVCAWKHPICEEINE